MSILNSARPRRLASQLLNIFVRNGLHKKQLNSAPSFFEVSAVLKSTICSPASLALLRVCLAQAVWLASCSLRVKSRLVINPLDEEIGAFGLPILERLDG